MNIQTHKSVCIYETDKGVSTIQVPATLFNFSKGKHCDTTFSLLQLDHSCGVPNDCDLFITYLCYMHIFAVNLHPLWHPLGCIFLLESPEF